MIKTTLLSVLILSAYSSICQPRIGVFAGPQVNSARYVISGEKQTVSSKAGFQAGVTAKIPFDNQLYFAPAVFYSLKGYKVSFDRPSYPPDTTAINNNTSLHTLEVAVMLQYDLGKKPDHLFIKSGLSLDGQLSGHEKYQLKNGTEVSRKMPFNFGAYGYAGANFLFILGFESKKDMAIFAQYSLGIGSINNADGGPEIKHRVIGLSFAKYFTFK